MNRVQCIRNLTSLQADALYGVKNRGARDSNPRPVDPTTPQRPILCSSFKDEVYLSAASRQGLRSIGQYGHLIYLLTYFELFDIAVLIRI